MSEPISDARIAEIRQRSRGYLHEPPKGVYREVTDLLAALDAANAMVRERDESVFAWTDLYRRAEARALAAEAERDRLRAALEEIADSHIPDQPAAAGGDELSWCQRQYGKLRLIADHALAQEPSP